MESCRFWFNGLAFLMKAQTGMTWRIEFKQLYPSFHLRFGIVYRRGGGVGAGV
jgi:hypothetical protein